MAAGGDAAGVAGGVAVGKTRDAMGAVGVRRNGRARAGAGGVAGTVDGADAIAGGPGDVGAGPGCGDAMGRLTGTSCAGSRNTRHAASAMSAADTTAAARRVRSPVCRAIRSVPLRPMGAAFTSVCLMIFLLARYDLTRTHSKTP